MSNVERIARSVCAALLVGGLAAVSGSVPAQAAVEASAAPWPIKPVRLMLGAPAGTAPDLAARIVGERLGKLWGQAVVIENKPGAGGTLAMEFVKGAPADGLTLMFAHSGAVAITPKLVKVARYDPLNDFTIIATVADSPMMMVAGNNVPQKTLPEILAAAKLAPGKLVLGSTEQATYPYLIGKSIAQVTGMSFLHVPFMQPGQALQALATGDVQFQIDGLATLMPQVRAGRVRAVALTSAKAPPGIEGIPLIKDTIPGFVVVGWFALLAPKGMQPDLAARINHDLNQVLGAADVAARLRDVYLYPAPKSQAETVVFLKAEVERWAAVIRKAGIEPM